MTDANRPPAGDMDPDDFRRHAARLADWIAGYLSGAERYPVLSQVAPGDIRASLPASAPESSTTSSA